MKKRIMFGAICSIVASFILFYLWSQGPSGTSVTSRTEVKGAVTTEEVKVIKNEYVLLQIPERFVLKNQATSIGLPLVLQQLYATKQQDVESLFSDQLAITVRSLPVGGLTELSDLVLRQRTDGYTKTLNSVVGAYTFDKIDTNYEGSAFYANDKYSIAVVITGPVVRADKLRLERERILRSIEWQ